MRHRAYRAALFSNFATGWAAFGLRIALVPLFVVEGLGRGAGFAGLALATFAIGNVSVVIPSGYLSDRIGRRKLLIVGLTVSAVSTVAVGFTTSLPLSWPAAYVTGAATGIFVSPQQAAVADVVGSKARGGTAGRVVPDDGRFRLDLRIDGGRAGSSTRLVRWAFVISGAILVIAAVGWTFAPETRGRPSADPTPARALGPEAGGELP